MQVKSRNNYSTKLPSMLAQWLGQCLCGSPELVLLTWLHHLQSSAKESGFRKKRFTLLLRNFSFAKGPLANVG